MYLHIQQKDSRHFSGGMSLSPLSQEFSSILETQIASGKPKRERWEREMSCTWMSQEFRDSMGYFTYTNVPSTYKWDILGLYVITLITHWF